MLKISRRVFIHAGCAIAAASLVPDPVEAWIHGSSLGNQQRLVINVPPGGFANLAKSWFPSSPAPLTAAQTDANGYPTGTLGSSVSGTLPMVPNFYDQYSWSFSGTGSVQLSPPAIVYSGGAFVSGISPSASGSVGANLAIIAQTNPTVVFKCGALVASVSGGSSSGSLVTVTTSIAINFTSGFGTGSQLKFGVGCSASLINGPNSDGSWTITNVSSTQFTLNGSTGVVSPTVTGTGGPGVQTEVIQNFAAISCFYLASTFTSFTNLVICVASNATAIAGGQIYDPVLVAQLQDLLGTTSSNLSAPGWLRFMDVSGVQGSFECDFANRMSVNSQCYTKTSNFPAAYAAGAITWSAGDAYSCANPSGSPSSGAPIDCEIIQGTPSAANGAGFPTLTITGRTGTWPIIDGQNPFVLKMSGPPASTGLVMQFTFTASWLNSGTPYVFSYTTTASGPFGNDTSSVSILNANLASALIADTTLASASIFFTNSAQVSVFPRTPQAGVLTIAYTSGPAICTVISVQPGAITTGTGTFIFSKLLGGFIYQSGGMVLALALEAVAQLCNQVGAHCWWNWPANTKPAYIAAVTNFFATNLTSGLKFGPEVGNEMWNTFANPWGFVQNYGMALGIAPSSFAAVWSYTALRALQYAALSSAAWTAAGNPLGTHYILMMTQVTQENSGGNFDTAFLNAAFLTTSNAVYAAFGGLGGGSSPSYTAVGNRPVDLANPVAIGEAPYWGSPWLGFVAGNITGPITENVPWLQASLDFSNGLTATAYTSMVNQFNGTTTRASGFNSNSTSLPQLAFFMATQESCAAQYDSVRTGAGKSKIAVMHYEGGPQWASGNNGVNGVNSVNSVDEAALANQMTALGWNVSPYTLSTTDNKTEMATMFFTMAQAWKHDVSYKNLIKTSLYQVLKTTSGANREIHPGQYGYAANQWGYFPQGYQQGAQYQNYNATKEWDQ